MDTPLSHGAAKNSEKPGSSGGSSGNGFIHKAWEFVRSFGGALLLVLAIRSTLVEAFKIPSGSMIPTLLIGDHIFVNKLAYGIQFDLFRPSWGDHSEHCIGLDPHYLFKYSQPKRGDIIVFNYPMNPCTNYIKRVMGIPGDKIEVKNKEVFINGQVIARSPLTEDEKTQLQSTLSDSPVGSYGSLAFHEKIRDDKNPVILLRDEPYGMDMAEKVVPEGHFFVMGDNRDNSNDSRYWGFVPMANVRGRASVIWLSAEWSEMNIRLSRSGKILD